MKITIERVTVPTDDVRALISELEQVLHAEYSSRRILGPQRRTTFAGGSGRGRGTRGALTCVGITSASPGIR